MDSLHGIGTRLTTEMQDKVCLVTGANSGIGKATALALARKGATVVMVCRSRDRGEAARADITTRSGNESVDLLIADLSSQQATRQVAEEFCRRYERLDALVNNAGAILGTRRVTEDGLEATFALNHLSYFLLTNLLIEVLKASAPSRIVNVGSAAHERATIDFDDLQSERRYDCRRVYAVSKQANVLFTYELARRLEGTGVTANCVHPGTVATNFNKEAVLWLRLAWTLLRPLLLSPDQGAETVIYLASSPELEGMTGKYFIKKTPVPSSAESYSLDAARRLWEVSADLTKLKTP
jgi:NAD(P)-dependent dehydrogenase (short-subunit alcohol dehydrogenase family)